MNKSGPPRISVSGSVNKYTSLEQIYITVMGSVKQKKVLFYIIKLY